MKSTKTKVLIIILSIVIVAVAGLLLVIFMLPKNNAETKQEEIWEYVFEGNIVNVGKTYFTGENKEELLANKKYETKTNISFDGSNIVNNEELTKHLKKLEIDIDGKVDKTTNQAMGSMIINYMKNEMFKLDYVKDNKSYGIKSDEVIDMYLGVRNQQLDLLFQKLDIPLAISEFEAIDYKNFMLEEEILDSVKENIKAALKEQISTDKFKKQEKKEIQLCGTTVNSDVYTLALTDEETYMTMIKMLEKLSENEQLLSSINTRVATVMGMQSQPITKETIQTYIEGIKTKTFTKEQMVVATFYLLDNKLIKLDVDITENGETNQYIIEALENSNIMNFTINTKAQENISSTVCSIVKTDDKTRSLAVRTMNNNEELYRIEMQLKNEGSLANGSVNNNISINVVFGQNNFECSIDNVINIVESVEMKNLSATNCAYINDMDKGRIEYLYKAISERLVTLYGEKMTLINSGKLKEKIEPANEQVVNHNQNFQAYEGEFAGNVVIEMLNKVLANNNNSEYLISIETKLTEEDTTSLKPEEVIIDKVQPLASLLKSSDMYVITMDYQPISGAIDKIKIVKKGLEVTEEQEVVMNAQ